MKVITYFVAEDITQFDNENDCMEYENDRGVKLRKEKLKVHIFDNVDAYFWNDTGKMDGSAKVDEILRYIWENWHSLVDIVEG